MKTFVVNLDRDADRWAAAKAQLDALGISYERLSAVDARAMSPAEKRAAYRPFRWWCAIGRPIRPGEIGCAMSHFRAWEAMDGETVCVLEDDVVLDKRFCEVLSKVSEKIDSKRPQVVLLSNHSDDTGIGNGCEGYRCAEACPFELRRTQGDMFTEGYVITRAAAEAIRRANWPMITPCDHWGRWVRAGLIELYHAFPTVCSQNKTAFASATLDASHRLVSDYPLPKWLCHKALRALGLAIDKALFFS